jgi:hypothetical protein
MAQIVFFDGKRFIEPVVYSKIVSGITNPPVPQSYGTVLIIDTGLGAGFGSGKGARTGSTNNSLNNFILQANDIQELLSITKGGVLYDLAKKLYNPAPGKRGANNVLVGFARDTAAAALTLTFTDTKTLKFSTKDEGLNANGDKTTVTGKLLKGYGVKLVAGTINPALFKLQFWLGSYKGKDTNGFYYSKEDEAAAADNPQLLFESLEFNSFVDFAAWAATNQSFNDWFVYDPTSSATGTVVTADLTLLAGFNVFAGGTETYSSDALTNLLREIKELDYTFILTTEEGATSNSIQILNHIINETKDFKKFLYVGGFDTKAERGDATSTGNTTSIGAAKLLNSEYAVLIHGGIFESDYRNESAFPTIKVAKPAIYKAFMLVGRKAGMLANETATYKDLGILMEQDPLEDSNDRELLLQHGVIHTRRTPDGNVINQDINTLQGNKNLNMFNEDGSSYQNSIMQIQEQINKTLVFNLRPKIIGQTRSTMSKAKVTQMVSLELSAMSDQRLIISFGNISANRVGTKWFINYQCELDTPYDGAFLTGTIIDTGN